MKLRLIMFLISIFCIVYIVSLGRSIYSLWQRGDIVGEREAVLEGLRQENQELEAKLKEVESPEFIEKQAREKLNLQKEGEVVVVLPKELHKEQVQEEVKEDLPNWEQWYRLFF